MAKRSNIGRRIAKRAVRVVAPKAGVASAIGTATGVTSYGLRRVGRHQKNKYNLAKVTAKAVMADNNKVIEYALLTRQGKQKEANDLLQSRHR